ncbi:B- and T-lymphocyte attenuator-like isoform X2 [Chanodichthys erythropterus]|uniref:B- and T-lymphocyte attenuator-like isoform X2 n=1 Tax=Chanodichthys erythropterus TaxID=933992 RepID=UPI00351F337A
MIHRGTIKVKKYKDRGKTEMINCNIAASLLLLSLSVSGTTNRSELQCNPVLKVPRNTVFKAHVMTVLKINCTVNLRGCHRSPRVLWCKIDGNDCKALNHSDYIKTEWNKTTEHEGKAFLIFLNISMEDAGLYRCKESETSVSHAINVTVTDNNKDEFSSTPRSTTDNNNNEFSPTPSSTSDLYTIQNDDQQWLRLYVYICSGIAGLVFIVLLTLIYVVGRQGRKWTRIDMADKNQHIKTQKSNQLPPHLYLNSDLLTTVIYRV